MFRVCVSVLVNEMHPFPLITNQQQQQQQKKYPSTMDMRGRRDCNYRKH